MIRNCTPRCGPYQRTGGGFETLVGALRTVGVKAKTVQISRVLEAFEQGNCRVIVVDADGVPGGAPDLVAAIRRSHPDVIVLVVASHPSTEQLIEFIRAGVYDCILKPIDEKGLLATIRFLCQRKVVAHVQAELQDELRVTTALLDQDEVELSKEVFRATEILKRLTEIHKKNVSQLTVLYQMGRDVSENENWSDALDRFLMALVNYTQAEGAALLLFSQENRHLGTRSNFHVEEGVLSRIYQVLMKGWKKHPRGGEIHCIESYDDGHSSSCLERIAPWRMTVIPLKHRNRALGFLILEKEYKSNIAYKADYHFLNTVQTIFAGEVANASHISELRQLSRFNQKVLDNINSGVITTNIEGYVKFFNVGASQMCPFLKELGKTHFDSLFGSQSFGRDFYKKIVSSRKDTHVLEVRCARGENEDFPARLSTTKMHDDNANGTVIVAIFEDLTERERLETEIRKNDRLRVLGQLSASVAHEIRNPLTGIATAAEVLAGKISPEVDEIKYIRAILEDINRLDDIIKNLLNYARPAKPQITACAVAEIAERVLQLLADQARQKHVGLDIVDRLNHDVCSADNNQLTQVLLNLVLNAIQACRQGDRVRILLSNESTEGGSGLVRIDVIDNGEGVPRKVRQSLFEPFVTTKTHGSGLGLAISQKIIEEHSGTIDCEFLSKGTRFSIHLPSDPNDSVARNLPETRGN